MESMEEIVSLCKRRGFVFQSSEIYGGINGFWDFGPLGVELRNNVKRFWWQTMVDLRDDVVGVDTSIIAHPQTWEASGHLSSFSDPMVDCKECKKRFRADQLPEGTTDKCPECGGELTEPRAFNLMFKTFVGAKEDSSSEAYLRPETCQSIFTQFKNVVTTSRQKVPFGIAQIGKSFRNEITPRNFIFRSREFEQMEMEFFIKPEKAIQNEWYEYWHKERLNWYKRLGIRSEHLHMRDHEEDELAHYASACVDVEYDFPFGRSELEGIANRGNYDLSQHIEHSKKDLSYFNQADNEKFVPAVIETSAGCDRTLLAVICDAYQKDEVGGEERIVMRFAPHIAPVKIGILPLSKKLAEPAKKLENDLRKRFKTDYDDAGSIGKRYRRQDEIGTPLCLTYDFDSETDNQVTIRHRDTTKQERVAIDQVKNYIQDVLDASQDS
ncbi:MAG: glycine--tRNA ligase [Deltaproteobacteria bacterium]|nr:glycine--tRNA ligase [Deltaproteobacteria bacterium]